MGGVKRHMADEIDRLSGGDEFDERALRRMPGAQKFTLIYAHDAAGGIGNGHGMPWPRIAEDMRRFYKATIGKPVIMGNTTFKTLGTGATGLPGRKNIVLSRQPQNYGPDITVANNLGAAFKAVEGFDEAMVIGGAQIYRAFEDYAQRILCTVVPGTYPSDTKYAPGPDWVEVSSEDWLDKEKLQCTFKVFELAPPVY